mgnify:FL=1
MSLKARKMLELSGFSGVDFTSSPLDVSPRRSPFAVNLMTRNGINRKRHGWNEVFRVTDGDGNHPQINGIFQYEENGQEVYLIHAGKGFYRARKGTDGNYTVAALTLPQGTELWDTRSEAYADRDRLYLVGCGDFLVYRDCGEGVGYALRRVCDDTETYVPVTTVDIQVMEEVSGDITLQSGQAVEEPNLLTPRRKNKLLGKYRSGETPLRFYLDEKAAAGTGMTVTIVMMKEIADGITDQVTTTYRTGSEGINESGSTTFYLEGTSAVAPLTLEYAHTLEISFDCPPVLAGESNITVTFSADTEDRSALITKSKFGALFGAGGYSDRLFLAGNPEMPGVDFYSAGGDFSYFSFDARCGSSTSRAITGYLRMNDGTLGVFRGGDNKEPSVYFRSGSFEGDTDQSGNTVWFGVKFKDGAGQSGEKQISRAALANFEGDKLLLTQNGVYAITLSDNVSIVERYTRNRSYSISTRLKKEEHPEEAIGAVFRGHYYLCLNEHCYVADASKTYTDPSGSVCYEWFYLENIPARIFNTEGAALAFGTPDGRICMFDDEFADRTYTATLPGDLTVHNGLLVYNTSMEILPQEGDLVYLSGGVYGLLFDSSDMRADGGRLFVSEENAARIVEGDVVYADQVGTSGLAVNTAYEIAEIDRGENSFTLVCDGETVSVLGVVRLLRKLDGQKLTISECAESGKCAVSLFGETIQLTEYNGEAADGIGARFCHYRPVSAEWQTPALALGSAAVRKTLLSLTVVAEPTVASEVSVGFETANAVQEFETKGLSFFSFETMDFNRFSFRPRFASAYTRKTNVRNFTFVRFFFANDKDTDFAVNSLTAMYTVNQNNKGVR